MAHAQKQDFVFRRNGRVHLNRRGASVQSTTDSRGVRISGSSAGYTMFRGSVKGTGYPLRSPVCPSLPLPCVTACHHISTGVYHICSCVTFAFIVIFLIRFSGLLYSQFKFVLCTHTKSLFPVWQTQWAYIKSGGTELWILVMVWRRKKDVDLCYVSRFVVFGFLWR